MWLLVGLGNPGRAYESTRHNLGWDALGEIGRAFGLSSGVSRFRGRFGEGRIGPHRVQWLMPETFMNLSGHSVAEAMRFYKVDPSRVVVYHDDLDLPVGKVRMKSSGGHGGHNGLRSIQQQLGTADFLRVRLGIGRPVGPIPVEDHVLTRFSPEERRVVEAMLSQLPPTTPLLLEGDLAGAMNKLANPSGVRRNPLPEGEKSPVSPPRVAPLPS
ncbi:MAG: aminoacyl-tRNA hydrolase [Magnetococcales bacterium]|nr:aminoacyl-tRNA hydrolase [Magnetococcales bacterium]